METSRIILRKWMLEDIDVLVENLNNEMMANNLGTAYPYTYEDAYRYIEDAIKYNKEKYAIIWKNNMKVMGGCGLHITDTIASGNLWIAPMYHGMGIGTEASVLLVKHCFEDLKINKMENVFFGGNNASKKMQEKVGAIVCKEKEELTVNGRKREKNKTIITRENFEKALNSLRGVENVFNKR